MSSLFMIDVELSRGGAEAQFSYLQHVHPVLSVKHFSENLHCLTDSLNFQVIGRVIQSLKKSVVSDDLSDCMM